MKYFTYAIEPSCVKHMFSFFMKCTYTRTAGIRTLSCRTVCSDMHVRNVTYIVSKSSNHNLFNDFKTIQCNITSGRRTFFTNLRLSQKTDLEDLFPLRFMFVRTNVSFWEEYPEGLQFDVGYVDTKNSNRTSISQRTPVIVALPSSVGAHSELTETLVTFAKLGYRVVIPNLPATKYCRGKGKEDEAVCQLSVNEKADFVKDFLRELGIEKVDMLITNGCSVYVGVSLCVFHTLIFKSLVMINPTGLKPTETMLPLWVHKKYTYVFDDRYRLQGFFKAIVSACKKFTKKSHWDTINVSTFSRTVAVLSFTDEKTRGGYFKARDTPRFAIFGENTDNFDIKSALEYLSLINLPKSAIKEINGQNKIIKEGEACNGNYGLHIQGEGSEDILNKRTMLLRKELKNILKLVRPDLQ